MTDVMTMAVFAAVSLLGAGLAILLSGRVTDRRRMQEGPARGPVFAATPRRYEFREGYLLTPVDENDAFLPPDIDRSAAFEALARALRDLSPEMPGNFTALARRGETFLVTARFGQDLLDVTGRAEGDRLIVSIGPTETSEGRLVVDTAAFEALRDETEDLRAAVDATRIPVWRQDRDGRVTWANAPYHALVERLADTAEARTRWPMPPLFDKALSPLPETGTVRRLRLARDGVEGGSTPGGPEDSALWFEVAADRQADGGILASALPVDRLVAAEASLRSFVQTLSKTFAHLPIGLAVFDRRRELMLFNPALVSLSMLEPQFLSRRPGLVAFLDALRDRQRMPEPKNYRNWRDEIARLEQDAEAGTYQEMWSLPDGQSFRVIGRPHPDGAIAFIFEDITAEVSLTRKFRGDLDLYRSALDDLPQALAVFSGEGRLVLANTAFAVLWGRDPEADAGVLSLAEATGLWQAGCAPSGAWRDIRDFADRSIERAPWSEEVITQAGKRLMLRVAPLSGGGMSVSFQPLAASPRRTSALPAQGAAPRSAAVRGRRSGKG
ncbi:PAS domain-containing protein [Rhodobacterales bacterium HKCCSP123]|nr:PAS domain-containing protein [Rhodobacterales bacterium HKCCSP123]